MPSYVTRTAEAGQVAEVRAYCLSDVAQTVAVFLRVQFLRGEVDAATCAHALRVLLSIVSGEPRLAPLLPRIGRERLLPCAEAALPLVRGVA